MPVVDYNWRWVWLLIICVTILDRFMYATKSTLRDVQVDVVDLYSKNTRALTTSYENCNLIMFLPLSIGSIKET